jgi:O-antigen ligase
LAHAIAPPELGVANAAPPAQSPVERPLEFLLRLLSASTIAVGLGLAVAAGYASTLNVNLPKLLFVAFGAASLPVLLINVEVGAAVFLGMLWAYLPTLAIKFYGLPSLAPAFGGLLFTASVVRQVLSRGRTSLVTLSTLLPVLPYATVYVLSGLLSEFPDRALESVVELGKSIAVFWILSETLRSRASIMLAVQILVLTAGFLSALTLHQAVTGNFSFNYGGLAQSEVAYIVGGVDSHRPGGPLNSPNYFAIILVVTVPMALALLRTRLSLISRAVYSISLVLSLMATLLTYSRSGFLILGLVLLLSVRRHRIGVAHVMIVILVLVLSIAIAPPRVWERLETLTTPFSGAGQIGTVIDDGVDLRLGAQFTAVSMFLTNPLLGVGAGNYPPNYTEYARWLGVKSGGTEYTPHNLYLEILAETGAAGFIAFLWLSASVLLQLHRSLKRADPGGLSGKDWRELILGLEFALLGYLAAGVFASAAYSKYFWALLGLVVAAVLAPGRESTTVAEDLEACSEKALSARQGSGL